MHATYTRRGDDLHCTVEVPMTAAALGTKLVANTLPKSSGRSQLLVTLAQGTYTLVVGANSEWKATITVTGTGVADTWQWETAKGKVEAATIHGTRQQGFDVLVDAKTAVPPPHD